MNHDHEAITDYALHLWRDWMSDNFSELRALWYPRESKGISSGWVVSEDAFQDLADECESRIVQCVQGVVAGMPPAMRGALEHSLGLCNEAGLINAMIEVLPPAHKALAIQKMFQNSDEPMPMGAGAVKAKRVTNSSLLIEALRLLEEVLPEARGRVYRAVVGNGVV